MKRLLLICSVLLLAGCDPFVTSRLSPEDAFEAGRQRLSHGDYAGAFHAFQQSGTREGAYGAAIAAMLGSVQQLHRNLQHIRAGDYGFDDQGNALNEVWGTAGDPLAEGMRQVLDTLESVNQGTTIELDAAPLVLRDPYSGETVWSGDFGGAYGDAERFFLQAAASFILGTYELGVSIDIHTGANLPNDDLLALLDVFAQRMHERPELLTFRPDREPRWQSGFALWRSAAENFGEALRLIDTETDGALRKVGSSLMLGREAVDIGTAADWLDAAELAAESFAGGNPAPVSATILPILRVLSSSFLRLYLQNNKRHAVTHALVGSLLTTADQHLRLNYAALVTGDMPPLRPMAPRYELDDYGRARFLMDWECSPTPRELADGSWQCDSASDRFVFENQEGIAPLPADGYAAASPYFVYGDPSLGGFLRELDDEEQPATQATLNRVVVELVDALAGLAGLL